MDTLFVKGKIGNLELKNRIIMTAMHTGYSIEDETKFLTRKSIGGAAAVTSVMGVSKTGAYNNMCVLDESMVENLNIMAESIHNVSGKLIVQLFHAGRNASLGMLADNSAHPVAPSSIASPIYKEVPKELSIDEISEIIGQFGKAAVICKKAGVDAVEISSSAGYLLSEFISILANIRNDEYGGILENRLRFPIEVVKEVRKSVGLNYPIILRVSASDMLGGYGIQETIQLVKSVEKYIDAVNVTGGWHESPVPQISMYLPEGGFSFLANEIKKNVNIPIIACNRINNENTAREVLELGYADFAGCARAFLIDSDFANKIKSGVPYKRCIGCNKGCIENVLKLKNATCIFNPEIGNETENIKSKKSNKQRVLVVGSGPAGIEAALQYAKRGNEVQLCTDEDKIGGQLHIAAKAPYKEAILKNIVAMQWELERFGVNICYKTIVDGDYINKYKPDMVIIATGSKPFIPPISGINQNNVYTAEQVLKAEEDNLSKFLNKKVLIIGGGSVGLETALYLSRKSKLYLESHEFIIHNVNESIKKDLECESNICIVEMTNKIGADLGGLRRSMINELQEFNISTMTNAKVEKILEDEVIVNKDGVVAPIKANYVIVAAGYKPYGQELINWLSANGYLYEVIGSAKKPGNIGEAISDAYAIIK